MELRFPDRVLGELRSALQNQGVFGLCCLLGLLSCSVPKSLGPSVLGYFETQKQEFPKTTL